MKVKPDRFAPHQTYKGLDGSIYPGGSTIAKMLDDGGWKIPWANKMGLQGIDCSKFVQRAADIGTIAHFLCECHVNGVEPDLSDFAGSDIMLAENSFLKFLDFWDKGGFTVVATEYQLVCPAERFGGTLDNVAIDGDGRCCLVDFKTCNGLYAEHFVQVAGGYRWLWDHADVQMEDGVACVRPAPTMAVERCIVLRLGKEETGDFELREVPESDWDYYWRGFKAGLQMYEWKHERRRGVKRHA
jgi:hypothetical protein